MAEALDYCNEVEVSSDSTHKVKRPRKKNKTEGPSGSASADRNASTSAQTQGTQKPQSQGQAAARKRKALIKSEKTQIVLSLQDLSVNDILANIASEVSSLCHIKSNPDKAHFGRFSRVLVVCEFVRHLRDTFAKLYGTCGSGKDKFMQFQLQ